LHDDLYLSPASAAVAPETATLGGQSDRADLPEIALSSFPESVAIINTYTQPGSSSVLCDTNFGDDDDFGASKKGIDGILKFNNVKTTSAVVRVCESTSIIKFNNKRGESVEQIELAKKLTVRPPLPSKKR